MGILLVSDWFLRLLYHPALAKSLLALPITPGRNDHAVVVRSGVPQDRDRRIQVLLSKPVGESAAGAHLFRGGNHLECDGGIMKHFLGGHGLVRGLIGDDPEGFVGRVNHRGLLRAGSLCGPTASIPAAWPSIRSLPPRSGSWPRSNRGRCRRPRSGSPRAPRHGGTGELGSLPGPAAHLG